MAVVYINNEFLDYEIQAIFHYINPSGIYKNGR